MSRFSPSIILELMRRHTEPYDVMYRGVAIQVFPGVLSPGYDWTGKFGVECLPSTAGKSFLEIGSGCGIVSVFASFGGACLVVAVDLSPVAALNTKFNFDRHKLSNTHVIRGNLFDSVNGRFDIVFFNAPFYNLRATDWLERAVRDEDYQNVSRFLFAVRDRINAAGCVVFGFGGDEQYIRSEIRRAGLTVVDVRADTRWGYACRYYMLQA